MLLRGVNVGGHNPLPMDSLRAVLTNAGFRRVRTYLQTGNIGLDARGPVDAGRIHELLHLNFGLRIPVVVFPPVEIEVIAMRNPFVGDEDDLTRLHVYFLADAPPPDSVAALDAEALAPDRFALDGRALYLHCVDGVARTKLTVSLVERALGVTATGRNMRTVMQLVSL